MQRKTLPDSARIFIIAGTVSLVMAQETPSAPPIKGRSA